MLPSLLRSSSLLEPADAIPWVIFPPGNIAVAIYGIDSTSERTPLLTIFNALSAEGLSLKLAMSVKTSPSCFIVLS